MSTLTVLLLCIQACLLQNVLSQSIGAGCGYGRPAPVKLPACGSALASSGYGAYGARYPGSRYPGAGAGWAGLANSQPGGYGGSGEGNVAVSGTLPVSGKTAIAGQVPIMGAVYFSGPVAAAGAVSIYGQSACGCGSPRYY